MKFRDKQTIKKMKSISFECTLNSPLAWQYNAWLLKRTAEEIDTFSLSNRGFSNCQAKGKDVELSLLISVYRLLMGLSFENLLKGIIIAHGTPAGSNGKLNDSFGQHNIDKLLKQVDENSITLTKEDRNILKELQPYVEWVGRYPIPKKVNNHQIAFGYGSEIHKKELNLWKRLSKHLKDVGWHKKAGS